MRDSDPLITLGGNNCGPQVEKAVGFAYTRKALLGTLLALLLQ